MGPRVLQTDPVVSCHMVFLNACLTVVWAGCMGRLHGQVVWAGCLAFAGERCATVPVVVGTGV